MSMHVRSHNYLKEEAMVTALFIHIHSKVGGMHSELPLYSFPLYKVIFVLQTNVCKFICNTRDKNYFRRLYIEFINKWNEIFCVSHHKNIRKMPEVVLIQHLYFIWRWLYGCHLASCHTEEKWQLSNEIWQQLFCLFLKLENVLLNWTICMKEKKRSYVLQLR